MAESTYTKLENTAADNVKFAEARKAETQRIVWQNNLTTPVDADNLNRMYRHALEHTDNVFNISDSNARLLKQTIEHLQGLTDEHDGLVDIVDSNKTELENALNTFKSDQDSWNSSTETALTALNDTVSTFLYPDMFALDDDGNKTSDSYRLQKCFDELVDNGGVICIDRMYYPTESIVIKHGSGDYSDKLDLDDNGKIDLERTISHSIHVKGVGKYAGIDCSTLTDDFLFIGSFTTSSKTITEQLEDGSQVECHLDNVVKFNYSGDICFSDLNIIGHPQRSMLNMGGIPCEKITKKVVNKTADKVEDTTYYINKETVDVDNNIIPRSVQLLRISFNSCTISGFKHVAFSNTYIQTLYFTNCTIRRVGCSSYSTEEDTYGAVVHAIAPNQVGNEGCVYDLKINDCIIEWCGRLLNIKHPVGVSITNNLIEGFEREVVKILGIAYGLTISNNYFEKNDIHTVNYNKSMYENDPQIDATTLPIASNINLLNMSSTSILTVEGNSFGETPSYRKVVILLPPTIKNHVKITGNRVGGNTPLTYAPVIKDHSGLLRLCNGNTSSAGHSVQDVNTAIDNALNLKPYSDTTDIEGTGIIRDSQSNILHLHMIEGRTRCVKSGKKADEYKPTNLETTYNKIVDSFSIDAENNQTIIELHSTHVGKNLFTGQLFVEALKTQFSKVTVDTENKTITCDPSTCFGDSVLFGGFEDKKQYTLIFKGSGGNIKDTDGKQHLNLYLRYTDGTKREISTNNIKEFHSEFDDYKIFKTDASKSVACLGGVYYGGTSVFYYDQCGIFEGDLLIEDMSDIDELFVNNEQETLSKTTLKIDGRYPLYGIHSYDINIDTEDTWYCNKIDITNKQYIEQVRCIGGDDFLDTERFEINIGESSADDYVDEETSRTIRGHAQSYVEIKLLDEVEGSVKENAVLSNNLITFSDEGSVAGRPGNTQCGISLSAKGYDGHPIIFYRLAWEDDTNMDVEAVRTALAQSGIKIYYVLDKPIITPLDQGLIGLSIAKSVLNTENLAICSTAKLGINYLTQQYANLITLAMYDLSTMRLDSLSMHYNDLRKQHAALQQSHDTLAKQHEQLEQDYKNLNTLYKSSEESHMNKFNTLLERISALEGIQASLSNIVYGGNE